MIEWSSAKPARQKQKQKHSELGIEETADRRREVGSEGERK